MGLLIELRSCLFQERVKDIGIRLDVAVTEDGPVTFHSLRQTGISRLANDRRIALHKQEGTIGERNSYGSDPRGGG